MVSRYTKDELKQILRAGACHIVAQYSFENFSTRKLSKHVGLSDPYIYRCYKTTEDLLLDCFYVFDKQIAMELKKTFSPLFTTSITQETAISQCRILWRTFWDCLIEHREETLYHWRFIHSGYYTPEVEKQRLKYYKRIMIFAKLIDNKYNISRTVNLKVVLDNIVMITILNTVHVIRGELENSEQNIQTLFNTMFYPVFHLIFKEKPYIEEESCYEG